MGSILTMYQRMNAAAASRSWFRLDHFEHNDYFDIPFYFLFIQRAHRHWAALCGNQAAIGSIIHIGTDEQTDRQTDSLETIDCNYAYHHLHEILRFDWRD